jgi:2-oxoglutarate dehydrogenase E2 component (dihydrolipoamide succinyltransferase)
MAFQVRVPSLGESVTEGTIVRWAKQDGDVVAVDEVLFELETDKANMEIPAESGGRVKILKPAGSTVQVGEAVADIEADGAAAAPPARPAAEAAAAPAAAAKPAPAAEIPPPGPAVRNIVAETGLDVSKIAGSGKHGQVTKADVLPFRDAAPKPVPAAPAASAPAARAPVPAPAREAPARPARAERAVPMSRIRKRIAERLVEAQRTAAILTTFNEIDMTAVMALRARYKEPFEKKHGVSLGFMSLFAVACVAAVKDVPVVNAEIRGDDVVYRDAVHLGIAVGTERGLVVPVVRDADLLSIAELETEIARLAKLARDGKLLPDDLAGGTFTISNGGVYGSLLSTPILNPPQSGILGMHKIEKRPVAVNDQVVIRPMMYVALSYDHRLVDGEQAVTFLVRVKERLEDPARLVLNV